MIKLFWNNKDDDIDWEFVGNIKIFAESDPVGDIDIVNISNSVCRSFLDIIN